jgi:hypothetical protein
MNADWADFRGSEAAEGTLIFADQDERILVFLGLCLPARSGAALIQL